MAKKNFLKHFLTLSFGTIINVLLGVIAIPVITRMVNPDDYGRLSIFTLYADICVMVLCLGLDQAFVRFFYKDEEAQYKSGLLKKCFALPAVITLILSIVFLLIYGVFKFDFKFDFAITAILCFFVLVQVINRFSMLLIRLQYKTKKYSLLNILNKALYLGICILLLLAIEGRDLFLLVIATVAAASVVTILGILFERRVWFSNKRSGETPSYSELLKYGMPFILSMGITTLFQSVDKLAIEYFGTDYDVGIYATALNIIHLFTIIQTTFNTMWSPMAIEYHEKHPEQDVLFKKAFSYITAAMFVFGISIVIFKDLLAYVLGADYRVAVYILPCLIFGPIMYTISETTVIGIDFTKRSYMHIIVAAVACSANIVGNILLVPVMGGKGAAISTGISYIIFFFARTLCTKISSGISFNVTRITIVSVVVFGYCLYSTFYRFSWIDIVLYMACLILISALYFKEIREMFAYLINWTKQLFKKEEKSNE